MLVTNELPTTIHVGLDVAKLTLQVDLAGRTLALANTPAGHRSLLTHLRRLQAKTGRPTHVVCEGTGGYERAVIAVLQAAGQPASVHNAARVRAFARAQVLPSFCNSAKGTRHSIGLPISCGASRRRDRNESKSVTVRKTEP